MQKTSSHIKKIAQIERNIVMRKRECTRLKQIVATEGESRDAIFALTYNNKLLASAQEELKMLSENVPVWQP